MLRVIQCVGNVVVNLHDGVLVRKTRKATDGMMSRQAAFAALVLAAMATLVTALSESEAASETGAVEVLSAAFRRPTHELGDAIKKARRV